MPPKVLQKNKDNSNTPKDSNNSNKNSNNHNHNHNPLPSARNAPKPPTTRLKLEIRRLPPGLTLSEFEETLGEEWKPGKGRVDWREFRQGKVSGSRNASSTMGGSGKMPELGRCYVHVMKEEYVAEFERRFLGVVFRDVAGTWKSGVNNSNNGGGSGSGNPAFLAPMLGFAMNQRVPLVQGKQRAARPDNRQGTIDQDAEYMAFLEAETQPIPKAAAIDSAAASGEKKDEDGAGAGGKTKVKSTPLIEDLRERKANKAKAAASKAEKTDKKGKGDAKGEESTGTAAANPSGGKKGDKGKADQAAKEPAKGANKQAAGKHGQNNASANATSQQKTAQTPAKGRRGAGNQNAKTAAAPAAAQPQPQPQATPAGPAAQRGQRQRGNAEGIKKMLQKDLGIKPKAAAAANQSATASASLSPSPSNQQTPTQSKNSSPAQTPKQQQQQSSSSTASATSNSGPPKAYLKHANPSQGMTEILIQQALAQFGEMNNVTIDPRKGTAIAVFKTQEGLKKAVEAKKVPVAKGAVEVIEFKDRGGSSGGGNNNSGGGGGGGGGRGGFRNRGGGRSGRGGNANNNNNNSGSANSSKGGGAQAAAAGGG